MEKEPERGAGRKVVAEGLLRADTVVQIALALPLSSLIGWAVGDFFARRLHHGWIAVLGLLLGVAAGFVQVVRLANQVSRSSQ